MTVSTAPSRVAEVRFDNAERGNCFTTPALEHLVADLESAAGPPDVSVVRLTMAGRHFCAGWDTTTFADLSRSSAAEVEASLRTNEALLDRIRDLPVPVVAAVRGRVAGFGAGLLAALHLPVAGADTTIALPEVGFGICPGGVLHTLQSRLPAPAVDLLVLTGLPATAADLLRWGLVAEVVDDASLDTRVDAVVEALAAQPTDVVRRIVAASRATRLAGTADPAYAAAAASVVALAGGGDR